MITLRCWLIGHDWLRQYEPGRFYLRCAECGTVTPGLRGPVTNSQPPVIKARPKAKAAGQVVAMKKRRLA